MNLDKIIDLIAEQIAREVLEGSSEDDPDRQEEEAMLGKLRRSAESFNSRGNTCLTVACYGT